MGWARVTVEYRDEEEIGEFEIHALADIDEILPWIRKTIEEAILRDGESVREPPREGVRWLTLLLALAGLAALIALIVSTSR